MARVNHVKAVVDVVWQVLEADQELSALVGMFVKGFIGKGQGPKEAGVFLAGWPSKVYDKWVACRHTGSTVTMQFIAFTFSGDRFDYDAVTEVISQLNSVMAEDYAAKNGPSKLQAALITSLKAPGECDIQYSGPPESDTGITWAEWRIELERRNPNL